MADEVERGVSRVSSKFSSEAFEKAPQDVKDALIDAMENRGFSLSDLTNICKSEIAEIFGTGGGIQIQLGNSLKYYEDLGLLREVLR